MFFFHHTEKPVIVTIHGFGKRLHTEFDPLAILNNVTMLSYNLIFMISTIQMMQIPNNGSNDVRKSY